MRRLSPPVRLPGARRRSNHPCCNSLAWYLAPIKVSRAFGFLNRTQQGDWRTGSTMVSSGADITTNLVARTGTDARAVGLTLEVYPGKQVK